MNRRAVDRNDKVVGPQSGAFGGRALFNARDHRALRVCGAERLGDIGSEVLDRHTDAAALDLAVADQLVHHLARHVNRYREADADISSGWGNDRRIDTDNPALHVDKRTTRIARINRRIGLDKILVTFDARTAAKRADDPRGHGLTEAERIADRQDKVADLQAIGIAHWNRRQIGARDLQHGYIGIGIAADQPCFELSIVLCRDLDAVTVFRDMAVRQHIALRGIDDDSRSGSLGLALDWLLLQVEVAPKQRIL